MKGAWKAEVDGEHVAVTGAGPACHALLFDVSGRPLLSVCVCMFRMV